MGLRHHDPPCICLIVEPEDIHPKSTWGGILHLEKPWFGELLRASS